MSYKVPGSSAVEISIKDVISLRGPPVKLMHSMKPEVTSIAEHYCLLPYINIIAEWASRKTSHYDSLHLLTNKAIAKYPSSPLITANHPISAKSESTKGSSGYDCLHSSCQKVDMGDKYYYGVCTSQNHNNVGISTNLHSSKQNAVIDVECTIAAPISDNYETKHPRDKSGKKKMKLEYKINEPSKESFQYMTGSSSLPDQNQHPINDGCGSKSQSLILTNLIHEDGSTHSKSDLCLILDGDQVDYSFKKQCLDVCDRNTLKPRHSCLIHQGKAEASALQLFPVHHKLHDYASRFLALATNKDDFEAIVFEFLKNRRDYLCCQHRLLEDFIAQCEINIQIMISGKNQISHPEEIMKACDFLLSSKVNRGTNLFGEGQLQPHDIRKRLFDKDLYLRNSCKELDEIFRRNHWILPKYCVFPSSDNRNFTSIITVKGLDFEHSLRGDLKDGPDQARESAAASMLTKLQEMAAQALCS